MEAINETPPKAKQQAKQQAKAKTKKNMEPTPEGEQEPKAKPRAKAKTKAINDLPTKKNTQSETLRDHINKKTFKEAERVFNNAIKHLKA